MIKLYPNKSRAVCFELELENVDISELQPCLRLEIDGMEYGCMDCKIEDNMVIAIVPPLKKFVKRDLQHKEIFEGKLDIIAGDTFSQPWKGEFQVENVANVKAKVKEDSNKIVGVKDVIVDGEKTKEDDKKIIKEKKPVQRKQSGLTLENLTEQHLLKFIEMNGTKSKRVQEAVLESARNSAKTDDPKDVFVELVKVYKKKKTKK